MKAPRRADVLTAYREELGPKERSLLWAWLSFTITFAIVRTITYSIKHGVGPFGNVSVVRRFAASYVNPTCALPCVIPVRRSALSYAYVTAVCPATCRLVRRFAAS